MAIADTAKQNSGKIAKQTQAAAEKQAVAGYDNTTSAELVEKKDGSKASTPVRSDGFADRAYYKARLKWWETVYLPELKSGSFSAVLKHTNWHVITGNPHDKREGLRAIAVLFDLSPWKEINKITKNSPHGKKKIKPIKYKLIYNNLSTPEEYLDPPTERGVVLYSLHTRWRADIVSAEKSIARLKRIIARKG